MANRADDLPSLARLMMRQAQLLKRRGLLSEARGMARRASELNHMAHARLQELRVPVRNQPR